MGHRQLMCNPSLPTREHKVRLSEFRGGIRQSCTHLIHTTFASGCSQFGSVAQSCPIPCDPMDCSTPGFPIHHQLLELAQPLSQCYHPKISSSVIPFSSSCLQSFPASGSFQMSWFITSGSQSMEVSASAPVLPMNIQD